jgi:4-hydroxy-tetrahydrodipicolinate reductase
MLSETDWAEIVGAVDVARDKVEKDLGDVVGLDKKLGVRVTADADALFSNTRADVVIHATTSRTLKDIYPEIIKPVEMGINVMTPCMDVSDPYLYDPEVSAKIDEITKKHRVSFLGIGSTQLAARVAITLTETCREIEKIRFTAHADVSKFPIESSREEFGIDLTLEEYHREMASGGIKGCNALKKEAQLIADRVGLELDEVKPRYEPIPGEGGRIIAVHHIFEGIKGGKIRVEYIYKFVLDPEHKYFHEIIVDGTPGINALIHYSPDRGMEGTIVPLVNSIPFVVEAPPGIVKMMDLDLGLRHSSLDHTASGK